MPQNFQGLVCHLAVLLLASLKRNFCCCFGLHPASWLSRQYAHNSLVAQPFPSAARSTALMFAVVHLFPCSASSVRYPEVLTKAVGVALGTAAPTLLAQPGVSWQCDAPVPSVL